LGSNLSRKWISLSTVFIVVSCIGTFSAAANPGTPHELTTTAGFSSGILIILNFLMNLFYFAMALLALLLIYEGRGLNPGGISKDRAKFFFRVILTAIVITISGGIIDAYLVYQSGATMRLVFDAVRWIAAVLLVFAVTYLSAAYIVRASARLSIFPASVLALINPVSWWLNSVSISMILLPVTFIVALFFVPILLMGLGAWHGRFSDENLAAVSEEEPEISRSRARSRRKGMALVGVSILIAVITFLSAISLALTAQWYDEGRSHQGPTVLYVGLREPITTLNPLLGSWNRTSTTA
jgi:hypothetical protein